MTVVSNLILTLIIATQAGDPNRDWPQWRGPHRDGISRETDWVSQGQSAVLWSAELGLGYSGVVISGDRLVTMGFDLESEEDVVWCLDAETGDTLWSHRYPAEHRANAHGGGTLSTPTIDDDVVYTINRFGRFFCRRIEDGSVVWTRDYMDELELEITFHGFCASPLLLDDRLYLTMGGTTAAVSKDDGAVIWKTKNYGDGSHTNATPITLGGRECLAVLAGPGLLVMDRTTGEEVHYHPWMPDGGGTSIATPIVIGERIFISTAYNLGSAMLEFSEDEVRTVWASRSMRNKIGDCILWDDHLYGFDESMFKCIDLEGKEKWRVRGLGMGTLSMADGRLIILSSKGELIIAQASPDEFRELSRTRVLEGGVYWTIPVLHEGRIYCRNSLGQLVCRDHRGETGDLVASESANVGALPEADDLFARHVEAIGGEAAWRGHQSMHLSGEIEITGAGITRTAMTIDRMAPDKWLLAFPIEGVGTVYRGFDGEIGWQLDPFYGNRLYEGDELREAAETQRLHGDLEFTTAYDSIRTTGAAMFGERSCWVVETVKSGNRGTRTHYFDRETGLMVGREGETEAMVIFADYAEFGDVRIPTRTTVLIPDTGAEENLYVDDVTFDNVDPAVFERTDLILRMLRTPEQIEAENVAAREKYAKYLGDFVANFDTYENALFQIIIDDGSLALAIPDQGAYPLNPPDENGHSSFLQFQGVGVTFLENEEGDVIAIRFIAPDTDHKLPRVKEDD